MSLRQYDEAEKVYERLAKEYPDLAPPRAGHVEARFLAKLSAGDLLFLYSDGAYESLESHVEESIGVERLAGMVERCAGRSLRETGEGVRALLEEASAPGDLEDDTTLMALRVRGPFS